jgi:hypothetical protein
MQEFNQQVIDEIVFGVKELDPVRRRMFLGRLGSHTSQLNGLEDDPELECLAVKLGSWFEYMSLVGILWEYRLIMSEIEWWHGLEQAALDRKIGVEA